MKKQVEFTASGIRIGDKELPLYSGAIHYWRMKPQYWEKALDNIKKMGFSIVETYIPWGVHEEVRGTFDFGERDSQKNLEEFLNLCRKKELYVIVRPGPHINAEMTNFGYPQWLLMDEEIQARTPQHTPVVYPYVTKPFPIPSYASPKLYQETKRYFHRLAPILHRHCYPQGGIIAIQADNETCNFFRDRPYVMDYSKASIELYHKMLKEKYQFLEVLNETYKTKYERWQEIQPPTAYEEGSQVLEPYFDWVEYKEYGILEALKSMVEILMSMNLHIPIFHNCAYQNYTPVSVQRDEKIPNLSVAGMDAYPEPGDTTMLKERIRYLAGSSRLPFVPEFGSGSWFDRGILLNPKEEEFGYVYAFMNGMKAVNFYMLAERDRWTGCPVKQDGSIRAPWFSMFSGLLAFLKDSRIHEYSRKPRVLILKNYDMGRLKALLSLRDRNTFSSNCFIHGTDIPEQLFLPSSLPNRMIDPVTSAYSHEQWIEDMMKALDDRHVEYNISDCYVDTDQLDQYDRVFASSYDHMEPEYQRLLAEYAKKGGRILWLGPVMPQKDRKGCVCTILQEASKVCDIRVIQCAQDLENCPELETGEYFCEDKEIEISVHWHPTEDKHLLYLANPTDLQKNVSLLFQGSRAFSCLWSAGDKEAENAMENAMEVGLQPWEIKIWLVIRRN